MQEIISLTVFASVHNPNNELVWLWRASLSESPKEAIFYLGEIPRWNHLVAFMLIVAAVAFAFWPDVVPLRGN